MELKQEIIVEQLLQEEEIKAQKEADIVLLDKGKPVMYEDAFRLCCLGWIRYGTVPYCPPRRDPHG